jgi:hypothetical protein
MHRGAFFWVKIDIEKAYSRGGGLAIVLEKGDLWPRHGPGRLLTGD